MDTRRQEIDPFEGIDDPTLRVQMQHEMRAIEELVFVTKLSFVPAHKDKVEGFRATLSCYFCRGYDNSVQNHSTVAHFEYYLQSLCHPVSHSVRNRTKIVL